MWMLAAYIACTTIVVAVYIHLTLKKLPKQKFCGVAVEHTKASNELTAKTATIREKRHIKSEENKNKSCRKMPLIFAFVVVAVVCWFVCRTNFFAVGA